MAEDSTDGGSSKVKVLIALIGAAAAILVGYWQFGRSKPSDPVPVPEHKAALAGRVYSKDKSGIEGATLTLNIGNEADRIRYSKEQGAFLFTGLPEIAGTLDVSAEGYKSKSRDVTPQH